MITNEERYIHYLNIVKKSKLNLTEAVNLDGRMSKSKIEKLLADLGDSKAQELNIIPKIFMKNGKKRIFKLEDVIEWMEKKTIKEVL